MSGTVMALIAQGAKTLALGDRVYECRAGQYLIASVDLPVTGHYTQASRARPALGFGLALEPSAIAELLLQAPPGDLPRAGGGTPSAMAVSDAPVELVDAAVRMLRLLDQPRDIPVLAPLIKREILWRLITDEQGAAVRQLGLADSSLAHVARAVRWIRDNYRESFRVKDAAQMSGMSVSAFYRNFRAVAARCPACATPPSPRSARTRADLPRSALSCRVEAAHVVSSLDSRALARVSASQSRYSSWVQPRLVTRL